MRCIELLKTYELNHKPYDIIIATRFDTKFLYIQPITILEEKTFYVPRVDACQNKCDANGLHGGVGYGSHLFWGLPGIIKPILDVYNWSDIAYRELHRWCGELMLKWFCEKNQIKVQHIDIKFMLIRNRGANFLDGRYKPLSATNHPEYLPENWKSPEIDNRLLWENKLKKRRRR